MDAQHSYMPQSKSDTHLTPDRVWGMIKEKWGSDEEDFFDPCPANADFDGLQINCEALNYVNPPYTLLKEFVAKAIKEAEKENMTIMLLPSKTDQEWFHTIKYFDILWIRKRLHFKNNQWSATQPHFLVLVK